jgi:exodeoxyribonuclease III
MFTFWDYFRNHWQTNSGLRIDHLLLSATPEVDADGGECRYVGAMAASRQRARTGVDTIAGRRDRAAGNDDRSARGHKR